MNLLLCLYLLALALVASAAPTRPSSIPRLLAARSAYTQEVWDRCHLIWEEKIRQMDSGPDGYYAVATASDDCPLPNLGSYVEEDTVVVVVSGPATPPSPGSTGTVVGRTPSAYSEDMYNRCHEIWVRQDKAMLGLEPAERLAEVKHAAREKDCPLREWDEKPDQKVKRDTYDVKPSPGQMDGEACKDAWQALWSWLSHCHGFKPDLGSWYPGGVDPFAAEWGPS